MTGQLPVLKQRIYSIDILRGLVMLIMALDHVRDFFHVTAITQDPTDLSTTTPILFFTRWITHYCAPTFVFLSGMSAFIAGQRKSEKELSGFLIKRGVWLIFIEVTVITFGLTYNPFFNFIILQVIWAIGFSMVILGLLAGTSMAVIIALGCLLFFGHNIFDYIRLESEDAGTFLVKALLADPRSFIPIGPGRVLAVFYTALPWTGIMLLGYAFGSLYRSSFDAAKRKKTLLNAGVFFIALFIVMRLINSYGDPAPWSKQQDALFTLLSFLNTTKYPPSLMFGCMTIGPGLIFLALTEGARSGLSKILMVYGRVPFFYYVLHFYIMHTLCVILFFASGYGTDKIADPNIPFNFRPADFGYDLWIVYLIWLAIIAALYQPCKWFNKYKATHNQWWLSYV